MANTIIKITFNQNLPIGACLVVETGTYFGIIEHWVATRTNNNEVTVGSPMVVPGEIDAINFITAFNLDINTTLNWTVTRNGNVVALETNSTGAVLGDAFCGNSSTRLAVTEYYNVIVEQILGVTPPSGGGTTTVYNLNDDVVALYDFQIDIIDNQTNSLPLVLEKAQRSNPTLSYHGADDRFQTLMTSELKFNLLVPDASDGKFLHLFTGSEVRYSVELNEVIDASTKKNVWRGFLLPEQFSEPYENGCFFVDFIATDGIGRLKNQYLSDAFYTSTKSIISIISECLKLTGNNLEIVVAPAIKNGVVDLKLSDLVIDTYCYNDGKRENAYAILEYLVESIGCRLFQQNNRWFIIGVNRFKDNQIIFERYDANGVYLSPAKLDVNLLPAVFEATPNIGIKPKLKTVTVSWDEKQHDNLLPSDVALQDKFNSADGGVIDFRYWTITGQTSTFFMGLSSYDFPISPVLKDGEIMNLYAAMNSGDQASTFVDLGLYLTTAGEVADITTHYIELQQPVYILGRIEDTKSIDVSISFRVFFSTTSSFIDIKSAFDNGDFATKFTYKLFLDDAVIATSEMDRMNYTLSLFSWFNGIEGKVTIKKLNIKSDGYLKLRLYAPKADATITPVVERVVYNDLTIKYKVADEDKTLIRAIDFTTQFDKKIFHCSELMDNSDRVIKIRDGYIMPPIVISTPAYQSQVLVWAYTITSVDNLPLGIFHRARWNISESDYNILLYLSNNLPLGVPVVKIKHNGVLTDYAGWTVEMLDIIGLPTQYYFYSAMYDFFDAAAQPTFVDGDELWIDVPVSQETISDKRYLRDRWARYEMNEQLTWKTVLAKIYHDSIKDNRYLLDGQVFGLRLPLDILYFDYLGTKRFVIVRLTINLSEGFTGLTAIERNQENVLDYE